MVNKAFLTSTGLSENQIVGKTIDEVIPESSLKLVYSKYKEAIRERKTIQWEENSKYPTGVKFGIVTISPIFDEKGQCTHLIGSVHDFTERKKIELALKESEAKYADLYDNAPDMFISVDAKTGKIIQCNNALTSTLGYDKDEIIGQPIFFIYHPESHEEGKKAMQLFLTSGKVKDAELNLYTKDGNNIDVSLNVSSVKDKNGKILYSRSVKGYYQEERNGI